MRRAAILLAIAGCLPEAYESERTVEWELPAPSAREVIGRFQACMTPASFAAAGMQTWHEARTLGSGTCDACHGADGMFGPSDAQFLFALRTSVDSFLTLFAFHPADGGTISTNRSRLAKAAAGEGDHPPFVLEPYALITDDFVRLTYEEMAEGACAP